MPQVLLKDTLKQRQMSQSALGRALGRPRQTVSDWATGKCEPTLREAIAISRITETPVEKIWLP